jgi:hypothetical protein
VKNVAGFSALWKTTGTVIPIMIFLVVFQVCVFKKSIGDVKSFVLGIILTIGGLHFFLEGISLSLLPLGEDVGQNLILLNRKWLIVVFAFILGYLGTLVEPALRILALEVEEISIGVISKNVLVHTVAIGFGAGMSLGVFKIINGISNLKIIVPLLVLSLILVLFTPEQFMAIAMDSASATTGPVNIPLNLALALGLSKIIEHADPLFSGFGIIGLTSFGAMISVLFLGILSKI